jgi:hypothetical protein
LIGTPLIHAPCLDLTPFITDATADNLKIVSAAGGNLSSNLPLYFDVGRQQVSPNTPLTFCLNGLPIPRMVGSTLCNTLSTPQQCFLAVGTKANDDGSGAYLDYCASSDILLTFTFLGISICFIYCSPWLCDTIASTDSVTMPQVRA